MTGDRAILEIAERQVFAYPRGDTAHAVAEGAIRCSSGKRHLIWKRSRETSAPLARLNQYTMKSLIIALLMVTAGAGLARAELFSPRVVPGAVIGGVTGAIIANNSGHRSADGAIIGAVAGGLIGAAIDQNRAHHRSYSGQSSRQYCEAPVVYSRRAPRVVYVPAPPRRIVYVEPRREVVVVRDHAHHRHDRSHHRHGHGDRRFDRGHR